ncbi:MAG: OmpW/AlkL family protein [Pontibacterium sp.]
MSSKLIPLIAAPLLITAATQTMAHEAGDILVRAGLANVNPNASDNLGLDIKDNTQLGVAGAYMLTDKVAVEVLAATPFKHTITNTSGARLGETKHLPPTVSVQYYPLEKDSKLQPYVGVGLNYTTFFNDKLDSGATLELKDSVGLAVQAGVDYQLSEQWFLNAAVYTIDIDSKVYINGAEQGVQEIDPVVLMMGVGYRF